VNSGPLWIFFVAGLAILFLADWIRRATEQLAHISGPAIGGLVNVTFGNATELILALFVLAAGHPAVVKGQITGSIVGNSLLGLGLAIVVGTWGREKLRFHRGRAGLLSSLLFLAVIGLTVPAFFDYTERNSPADRGVLDERLSLGVSCVLLALYVANLFYTLITHRDVFRIEREAEHAGWSAWTAILVLAAATALSAFEAHLISSALEASAELLHLSTFFLGVTVLAVIGNAGEYTSAIYFARQKQMSLTLGVTIGSTIQVAILLAPLLVVISYLMGNPMNLVFSNPLELISIVAVALIISSIAQDGETNWFEGVLLLAVYAILTLAFFFAT
jgi:Ca2+:H+ antiporter